MPRRPRLATGGLAYHVPNRRIGRLPLFDKAADYLAFEKILQEAHDRIGVRIAAYCLMPNHWHLLLWPRTDGELSEVMRWITVTHTQRRGGSNRFRFKLTSTSLPLRGMLNEMLLGPSWLRDAKSGVGQVCSSFTKGKPAF